MINVYTKLNSFFALHVNFCAMSLEIRPLAALYPPPNKALFCMGHGGGGISLLGVLFQGRLPIFVYFKIIVDQENLN